MCARTYTHAALQVAQQVSIGSGMCGVLPRRGEGPYAASPIRATGSRPFHVQQRRLNDVVYTAGATPAPSQVPNPTLAQRLRWAMTWSQGKSWTESRSARRSRNSEDV